jgi:hypothetical protein
MPRYTYDFYMPGRHEAEILPRLYHQIAPKDYVACPDPATCTECRPKLAKRRAFFQARGQERVKLRAALDAARSLDRQEEAAARRPLPEGWYDAPF